MPVSSFLRFSASVVPPLAHVGCPAAKDGRESRKSCGSPQEGVNWIANERPNKGGGAG
jgi:hypothetical protein